MHLLEQPPGELNGQRHAVALIGAYSGTATIQYSDIQDSDTSEPGVWVQSGWTAPTPTAWFDVDPDFVEDPDAGSDGWGNSNDDFGDLRLTSTSTIINRGDCSLVPNDEGDVNNANGTSEVLPLDLGLVHRRIDRVEMGAFEYQTPQHEYCAFDINDDNAIGVADLLAVIVSWGPCPGIPTACLADIAPQPCTDGAVGVADLLAVIAHWANVCGGTPSNDAPQTVQDCMDICGGQFGFGSPEYCNCMEKCCSTLP